MQLGDKKSRKSYKNSQTQDQTHSHAREMDISNSHTILFFLLVDNVLKFLFKYIILLLDKSMNDAM